jgi:hypothetical protein
MSLVHSTNVFYALPGDGVVSFVHAIHGSFVKRQSQGGFLPEALAASKVESYIENHVESGGS